MKIFNFGIGYQRRPVNKPALQSLLFFALALFQLNLGPAAAQSGLAPTTGRLHFVEMDDSEPSSEPPATLPLSEGEKTGYGPPEHAALYEEDPTRVTNGRRYVGSVVWHTETIKHDGLKQGSAVRADIDIPDRKLKTTMLIFRNIDASFRINILPADFGGGGGVVDDVTGVSMKPGEQLRGVLLSGPIVRVADRSFRLELSNVDAQGARNLEILKEGPWFSMQLVYRNLHRAILVFEKGKSGYQAFRVAFGAG
jgi:hypothetical protein